MLVSTGLQRGELDGQSPSTHAQTVRPEKAAQNERQLFRQVNRRRARIVLLSTGGVDHTEIARRGVRTYSQDAAYTAWLAALAILALGAAHLPESFLSTPLRAPVGVTFSVSLVGGTAVWLAMRMLPPIRSQGQRSKP